MKKNILTRSACVLTAAFLLVCSVMMFMPGAAVKANAAGDGFWSLYEVVTEGDNEWKDGWNKTEYEYTVKAEPGKYTYSWKCNVDYYSASGDLLNLKGDASTVICTNTAPPSIINGGDTVSVGAVLNGHYEKRSFSFEDPSDFADGGNMSICAIYNNNGNDYSYFSHGGSGDTLYTSEEEPTVSRTFTCEIRGGRRDGDELAIRVSSTHGAMCHYKYRWFSGEAPDEGDSDEEGGYWKEVDRGQTDTHVTGSRNLVEQYSDAEWSASEGSFYFKNTKKNLGRESWYPEDHNCDGESVEETLTIGLPERTYLAGDTISLKVDSTVTHNTKHGPLPGVELSAYLCHYEAFGVYGDNIGLIDDLGKGSYGITMVENAGYRYNADGDIEYAEWGYEGQSTTVTAQFPEGTKEGEELWLVEDWDGQITYWYKYVWVKGSPDGATGKDKDKDKEDDKYYWRYDGVQDTYGDSPAGSSFEDGQYVYDNDLRSYKWSWKPESGGCRFRFDYLKNETNDYDGEFHDKGGCKGEYAIFHVTGTELNRNYLPGETANMRLKIDAEKSEYLCRVVETTAWGFAYITRINPDTDPPILDYYTNFDNGNEEAQLTFGFRTTDSPNESIFMDVSAKMPKDAKEGDVVYVVLHCQAEDVYYKVGLRYVYTKGTPVAGGTVGFKGGKGQFFETIDRNAWETPGEDGGVNIPLEVFGGVVGVIGCIGGSVAAAGATKKKGKKGSEKKSSFKLIIYKDFGNSLRKGAAAVPIYARIAEYGPDGVEIPRNYDDLTSSISWFSDTPGVEVIPIGEVNGYMGANVRIPDVGSDLTEAVICARFSSFGGAFTEKVHFRAIGRPQVEVYTTTKPAKLLQSLVMLPGSGKTSELDLVVNGFAEQPTDMAVDKSSPSKNGEDALIVKTAKTGAFTYRLTLNNMVPEGLHDTKLVYLRFQATNAKETAVGVLQIHICPEGISVLSPPLNDKGMIVVNTEDADPGPGVTIPPTVLKLICCHRDKNTGELVVEEKGFDISRFKPTDEATKHVLNEFECEITNIDGKDGEYYVKPKQVLPIDTEKPPLVVTLPLAWPMGFPEYTLEVPVFLEGEHLPNDKPTDADKERELLIRACNRYGLTNNGKAQQLMRLARGTDPAASVLRQIRYAICYEANLYYSKEAEQMTKLGDKMDRIVTILSVAKWFGEQCRTYLLKRYTGDLGELLLNPLIDLVFVDIGGEFFFRGGEDYQLQDNILKKVEQIAENKFSSLMTDPFTSDSFSDLNIKDKAKKASGWIVCFYATVSIKYYYLGDETKGDIGRSCLLALKDLGSTALKTAISKALGDWLNKEQTGPKSFTIVRKNADTGQTETVQSSYVDMMMTNTFRWFKRTTGKSEILKKFFDHCIRNQKAFFGDKLVNYNSTALGGALGDALADVFTNSTVDSIIAMFTGDRFVLKIGDAELHFDLTESLELVREYFMTFFGIDYFMRLLGKDQEKLPQVPDAIPYATLEETQELEKRSRM